MKRNGSWRHVSMAAALLLVLSAGTAMAQLQSGNVFGTVTDNQGEALPGVTVTISGQGAPQVQVTDAKGMFRFVGLSPGGYQLAGELEGFSSVEYPNIMVSVGKSADLEITLSPAIAETITVTSESPLLDSRKISAGSSVAHVELEKIPSARDPWVVVQTVPGVKIDRINVGGNESGQQSNFLGPGSSGNDVSWAVDGVIITDMQAVGASPAYYNFDSFEEINVATGGSDITLPTGGVNLNMVTKRGTNEWRGTARYIVAKDSWQSGTSFSSSELGPGQPDFTQGNQIDSIDEYGADIGGPIVKDRLWFWANYGYSDIGLLTVGGFSDVTELTNYGGKLNWQVASSNSAVGYYAYNEKIKTGRNAGPTRPQETTWNQTGPGEIYKVEDTHIFTSAFYLTGLYAFSEAPFDLIPQGGLDGPATSVDADFVWHNNFLAHTAERPADQFNVDGDYFFSTGNTNHELKFGVGYRDVSVSSASLWPGDGVVWPGIDFGYAYDYIALSQTLNGDASTTYTSVYAQDTMTFGNFTVNVGLRWDEQKGQNNDVSVPGVTGFETFPDGTPLLPAVSFESAGEEFSWSNISPRLGLTYALGEDRKTLLRASYARFAEQLRQSYVQSTSGVTPGNYRYAYFYFEDGAYADGIITPDEIVDYENYWTNGYNVTGAGLNMIDPDFSAPVTDEVILGVEHAVRPEFVVGLGFTWRNKSNIEEWERLVNDGSGVRAHQSSDYVLDSVETVTRPDGTTYDVPLWTINPDIEDVGGYLLTNGSRETDYFGYSLIMNKRLANRWMARANLTWGEGEWSVPASENEDPNIYLGGANRDGGKVIEGSGTGSGSKGGVYISPGWSYSVTGLYQIAPDKKWGFNISAAVNGREGYYIPYYLGRQNFLFTSGDTPVGSSVNLQATNQVSDYSLSDVHVFDLRLEKEWLVNQFGFVLGLEAFNIFNDASVLQREHRLERSNTDWVREIVSPRIGRISLRVNFN